MPETPKKDRDAIGKAISFLNHEWDLQLPMLHGAAAEAAESTSAAAKRCAARIRYLAFRVDSLDTIIDDFHTRAVHLYSKWTFKPHQEPGTLPRFQITKSHLANDVKRRRLLGLHKLTKDQTDKLLELLDSVLKDDYELARQSESFKRTPGAPASCSEITTRRRSPRQTATAPFPRSQSVQSIQHDDQTQLSNMRKKRSSEDSKSNQSKRSRSEEKPKRPTVRDLLMKPPSPTPVQRPILQQSFETTPSSEGSIAFNTPDHAPRSSSANTSVVGDDEAVQDYFTEMDTEGFESTTVAIWNTSFSADTFAQKLRATFEIDGGRLPSGLSFERLYELQTLSRAWNLRVLDLFKELEQRCGSKVDSAEDRWRAYLKVKPKDPLAQETFGKAWTIPSDSEPSSQSRQSIYLSASLQWSSAASDPLLFKVLLHGPTSDRSCRFHRIFGGDRFLTLNVPFVQRSDLPTHLRDHSARLHAEVVRWLAFCEHQIAGRTWRAFWIDNKPPKATKDKPSFNKFYLFATSGIGLSHNEERISRRPLSIEEFVDLHTPFQHNAHSNYLKIFARFKLGLSKTTPTVVLKREQFRSVPDTFGGADGKTVMNDGCALMSPALAHKIAGELGLTTTPSAFQGRISGAKGLWIVDYHNTAEHFDQDIWIQVSSSQLKVMPHPADREDSDVNEEYRRFEVSDWSKAPQPATLNTQFTTVLDDRGVPRLVQENCLREHVTRYYDTDLCNGMKDPRLLRLWLQQYHRVAHHKDQIEFSGGFPRDRTEKINMLLDAGFHPQDCSSPLRDILGGCIKDYLTWWADKLKITIMEESTFLFCVPDPCGVLEEGEVFCNLSKGWTDPKTGIVSHFVAGRDALVARSPANHPSDIQRVKLVFKAELQNLRDVVVFPTKGKAPLASYLSGGDYDGDQCLLCWRPSLVQSFQNYEPGPPSHISAESCGLVECSKKLSKLLPQRLNSSSVNEYFSACFDFNIRPPMVGPCTAEHEKVVYHRGLRDEGAIKLSALAAYLVDSRKQGHELTEDSWHKIRVECSGKNQLAKPAFKELENVRQWNTSNINDHLRFEVAREEVEQALTHYHRTWPRKLDYDSYFASIWVKAWSRAEAENDEASLDVLKSLRRQIQEVVETWKLKNAGSKADDNPERHPQAVAQCFELLRSIEPLDGTQKRSDINVSERYSKMTDIRRRYEDEKERQHSYWNLLRASCFYSHHHNRTLVWYMVGEELCFLQAERSGGVRSFAGQMYAITKVDKGAVRSRLAATQDLSFETGESFDLSFAGGIRRYLR